MVALEMFIKRHLMCCRLKGGMLAQSQQKLAVKSPRLLSANQQKMHKREKANASSIPTDGARSLIVVVQYINAAIASDKAMECR